MAYDYGFGELGNRLITLFRSAPPDFDAAEELLMQGADINAIGRNDDENILSEILIGYPDAPLDELPDYDDADVEALRKLVPDPGSAMCDIIRFFLAHGFDVTKREGCFGAQCLYSLTLTTDYRHIIEATKLLIDAGAINRTVSLSTRDEDYTPWSSIEDDVFDLDCLSNEYSDANLCEAVYQIYRAIDEGKPYRGIDSYGLAIGKKIRRVFAESSGEQPVFFSIDTADFKHNNCYNATLYLVYDDGVLVTTRHADCWTNTVLPSSGLVDVTEHFAGIVGGRILRFVFGGKSIKRDKTRYTQLIFTIEMDSGSKVRFATNNGEVSEELYSAYFEVFE